MHYILPHLDSAVCFATLYYTLLSSWALHLIQNLSSHCFLSKNNISPYILSCLCPSVSVTYCFGFVPYPTMPFYFNGFCSISVPSSSLYLAVVFLAHLHLLRCFQPYFSLLHSISLNTLNLKTSFLASATTCANSFLLRLS